VSDPRKTAVTWVTGAQINTNEPEKGLRLEDAPEEPKASAPAKRRSTAKKTDSASES